MIFFKKLNLLIKSIGVPKKIRKSILNNLKYIFTFIDKTRDPSYSSGSFFFKPSSKFYQNCDDDIQESAKEILKHCGLDRVSLEIIHEYLAIPGEYRGALGFNPGLPGQMYSMTKYQFKIFVNNTYSQRIMAATLAHEIAHVYVRHNEIEFKTKSDDKEKFNEQMTDLLTIALGLGPLMLEGNSYVCEENNVRYSGTLGYFNPNVFEYAQALVEYQLESRKSWKTT